MRYTGIQPQYFPRLHYFARILNADIFMIRDDCQFVRKHKYPGDRVDKSYQAHSPVKTPNGLLLLSIPTASDDSFVPLYKTKISYTPAWNADHEKALAFAYGGSPMYSTYAKDIHAILFETYDSLASLNCCTIFWGIMTLLGETALCANITLDGVNKLLAKQHVFRLKKIQKATDNETFMANIPDSPNEKILMLLKETKATEDYCGGTATASYMDHNVFADNGITVTVQDWTCREYQQRFPKHGFIPNLSIIDLLMNVSSQRALDILTE